MVVCRERRGGLFGFAFFLVATITFQLSRHVKLVQIRED